MSLLDDLPYSEFKKARTLSVSQCENIAKLAKLNISFNNMENPGEHLIKLLDRYGYSINHYNKLMGSIEYFRPRAKVAILIANNKYKYLSKLATPPSDCDSLGAILKSLGFIVVTIKNTVASELHSMLSRLTKLIPEDSYCFIFYGGHGCQIGNIKCMLGVDCPEESIEMKHCVTDSELLIMFENCKPDLCVLIMDMCSVYLNREKHPMLYQSAIYVEEYGVHKNLLIGCSTQPSQSAYEVLQIECSASLDSDVTYELKTGDTGLIVPGASQYVNALCSRFREQCDVSSLLDKVHCDMENARRKQKPVKVQYGTAKRFLSDAAMGNIEELLKKVLDFAQMYKENCSVCTF